MKWPLSQPTFCVATKIKSIPWNFFVQNIIFGPAQIFFLWSHHKRKIKISWALCCFNLVIGYAASSLRAHPYSSKSISIAEKSCNFVGHGASSPELYLLSTVPRAARQPPPSLSTAKHTPLVLSRTGVTSIGLLGLTYLFEIGNCLPILILFIGFFTMADPVLCSWVMSLPDDPLIHCIPLQLRDFGNQGTFPSYILVLMSPTQFFICELFFSFSQVEVFVVGFHLKGNIY